MDERPIKEHFCYRELSHGPCNVVKQELICAAISVISLRRNGASFTDEAPPTPAAQPPPTSISSPLHLLPPFSILIRTVRSANPPTVETWKRYTDYAPGIASFCPIPRAQLKILSHQWLQRLHILVMDPIMLMKAWVQKSIITDTIGYCFIFTRVLFSSISLRVLFSSI